MDDLIFSQTTMDGGESYAGVTPSGGRPAKVSPTKEVVAGGNGLFDPTYPRVLPKAVDDIAREIGWKTYDAMLTDPAVSSAVETLILAIVADGPQVTPCIKATPGEEEDGRQKRAREMAEFGRRYLSRPGVRILDACVELLMGCCYGSWLAEQTLAECEVGDDAGLLVLDRLKGKPHNAWRFVVDGSYEVTGIAVTAFDPKKPESQYLDRSKFAILSWMPRKGDPRGQSVLRPAYNAWNLKINTWPQYYQHLTQFGGNSVVGELPPGAVEELSELTGLPISAARAMLDQLIAWQSGSAMVVPNGGKVYTVGGQGDGSAFTKAVELFDQQITQAILLQTRATKEAQHGSKADSESGGDIFGLLVRYGRSLLGGVFRRDVIYRGIEINFGKADADEFCPEVSFGETEHQDKAPMILAIARAWQSGFLDESQVPGLCTMMGVPVPSMEALQMRLDREAAKTELDLNPPAPVIAPGPAALPKPKKGVPA